MACVLSPLQLSYRFFLVSNHYLIQLFTLFSKFFLLHSHPVHTFHAKLTPKWYQLWLTTTPYRLNIKTHYSSIFPYQDHMSGYWKLLLYRCVTPADIHIVWISSYISKTQVLFNLTVSAQWLYIHIPIHSRTSKNVIQLSNQAPGLFKTPANFSVIFHRSTQNQAVFHLVVSISLTILKYSLH